MREASRAFADIYIHWAVLRGDDWVNDDDECTTAAEAAETATTAA